MKTMPRRKIHFNKLPHATISVKIQFLAYALKESSVYAVKDGWYRSGIDKMIYGYSANNYQSFTKIKDDNHLELMIYRVLYDSYANPIFRQKVTDIGHKKLDLDLENQFLEFGGKPLFTVINSFVGRELKKEYAHPQYKDRTYPQITKSKFTISESGYHIFYEFSFKETEGSSWTKEYWSNGRTLIDFLEDSLLEIDNQLIEPFIF